MSRQWLLRLRPTILYCTMGLLCGVVLSQAVVIYVSMSSAIEALMASHLEVMGDATAGKVERLLGPAPQTLEELSVVLSRGLAPEEPRILGELFVERMRQDPALGWLGYADGRSRSFVGGHRDRQGVLRFNYSAADRNGGIPTELVIGLDGAATEIAPENGAPYDPTARPWYLDAVRAPGIYWMEPYAFGDGALGLSVMRRVVRDEEVVGVLLADFFLTDLMTHLDAVRVGNAGRVYVVTQRGYVLGAPDGKSTTVRHALSVSSGDSLQVEGVTYRTAHKPLRAVRGLDWQIVILVPESEVLAPVREATRIIIALGVLGLMLGILGASLLAHVISRPINRMSKQLTRMARLDLADGPPLRSVLAEIDEMSIALERTRVGLRSFARYVPVNLVRRLLDQGIEARLGAWPRDVTIVFTDIANFTTIVEQTLPSVILDSLSQYIDAMNTIVTEEGGVVLNHLGDGLIILFGGPEPQEDHVERACRATLRMRECSETMAAAARKAGTPVLYTRFGINSGATLLGNIGASERFSYNVLGDTVNTASRLEGLNRSYGTQILLGPHTAAAMGAAFQVRPLGYVRVKGKEVSLCVHELLTETTDASTAVVRACALYREALNAYLERRFADAASRYREAVAILGSDDVGIALAEHCERLQQDPPGPEWDGVQYLHP